MIPKSVGANIAELGSNDAALIVLGTIADVPAHNAAKAAIKRSLNEFISFEFSRRVGS